MCPISSVLTGGCPNWAAKHAVVRFAEDRTNFSISKDDSMITGSTLDDEYRFVQSLGLNECHIVSAVSGLHTSSSSTELKIKDEKFSRRNVVLISFFLLYFLFPEFERGPKQFPQSFGKASPSERHAKSARTYV